MARVGLEDGGTKFDGGGRPAGEHHDGERVAQEEM